MHFCSLLHYSIHKCSDDADWVTFIHGAGGSSSIWFKQIREYKAHFNVLLLDLRGHGKSKNLSLPKLKKYDFKSIGDDVIEVLDHLAIHKTHFVGISLGTVIARELADRFPERTSAMILGGAVMKLNLRGQVLMRLGVILKSVIPYLILYKFFAFIIMPKKTHQESRILFVNEARKLYQKEFIRWFKMAAEVNPLLKLFRINDNKTPTLYIMGSQDHMFLPSIKKLIENHSLSSLEIIPECGHVVNVEQPHAFNKISLDYLKSQ